MNSISTVSGDAAMGRDVEKFLHKNRRFSFRVEDANNISAVNGDAAMDGKGLKEDTDDKRTDHNRRSGRDRRSGLDTRSEEESFLQGERRSGVNRRSGTKSRYQSFKKARAFVRGLGLKSVGEWHDYNKSGMRPDDIPLAPHNIYVNDGWAGWGDWLGASAFATYMSRYRFFKNARAFVRGLGLDSLGKWQGQCKSAKKPADIPDYTNQTYANDGCAGMRGELDRLTGGAIANGGNACGGGNGSKAERKKAAPKYRGPDGKTWTGRGVKPRWLTRALMEGKKLEDFLIVQAATLSQ